MNTPEPCSKCAELYYDPTVLEDKKYTAECKLDLKLGDINCKEFKKWDEAGNK